MTDTLVRTKLRISEFSGLPDRWHFGEGKKIARKIINNVKEICEYTHKINRDAITDAFPTLDGGLLFSVYVDGDVHQFEFTPDGTIEYFIEDDSDIAELGNFDKIIDVKQKIFCIAGVTYATQNINKHNR